MEGSSSMTFWKRLSRAESFSILLYSAVVVEPRMRSSPLANAGLRILAAFVEPSASPAPIMVWSSSITRMMFSALMASFITPLIRLSNWPLNCVPATIAGRSNCHTCMLRSFSGTVPSTILTARPCATAVLPTPGAPISTGLFLDLLLRIWMQRSISASRPMMRSILPSAARSVRLVPNSLRYLRRVLPLALLGSLLLLPSDASSSDWLPGLLPKSESKMECPPGFSPSPSLSSFLSSGSVIPTGVESSSNSYPSSSSSNGRPSPLASDLKKSAGSAEIPFCETISSNLSLISSMLSALMPDALNISVTPEIPDSYAHLRQKPSSILLPFS